MRAVVESHNDQVHLSKVIPEPNADLVTTCPQQECRDDPDDAGCLISSSLVSGKKKKRPKIPADYHRCRKSA